jgi:acetyltransferase-like isoleucine patch superfamily enzyme
MIGQGVKLTEPWLVKLGHHVLLGDNSHLASHKVEGSVVTLEDIEIGDETVVGAGAIVFPGCRIGKNVTIGAKSTVSRGTVIPDGETWVGIPARKYDYFSRCGSQGPDQ